MIVIFTNGVFDLFHKGHYNLLKKAKEQGDYLLVGVASDESCSRYKRVPFQNWKDRADRIRSIDFVDEVIESDWSINLSEEFYRQHKITYQVQGDKGSSYGAAERLGILKVVGTTHGISTTKILNILDTIDYEIMERGYLNEVRRVFFEGEFYIIKYGLRSHARKYEIELPDNRIKDEYAVINTFRSRIANHDFITHALCSDYSELIIFESAPIEGKTLLDQLLDGNVPDVELFEAIIRNLAVLHNATYKDDKLREQFENNKGFLEIKVKVQCLNPSPDISLNEAINDFVRNSLELKHVLLHGDFAPKNIITWNDSHLFIDFEESAYSDPALDVGYFLAHLIIHQTIDGQSVRYDLPARLLNIYLTTYAGAGIDSALVGRINRYVGIFLISRIYSKAPADYLPENLRENVYSNGRKYFLEEIGIL